MKFADSKGAAQKDKADTFNPKFGDNKVRMVGDVLPRYVYWVKGTNDKNLPVECLAFNREAEAFKNGAEKDWVQDFYPDIKCGWAYVIQVIDPEDGKIKLWNLKKKLTQSILDTAKELGDPTDPEKGWDIYFEKKKTGPHVYNVEYSLDPIKCMKNQAPLTDEQKELIVDIKPMSEILPRPTSQQQHDFLESLNKANTEEENIDEEIDEELNIAGDA